ncbi:hypothetical protein C789_1714 [Microcystis aeruginosa FACHB-905 = DIANCHI905]|uniref:Uncharacterized protein n=1 Tax=Microcystis aeruginosa PCC 7806SL TaxID=1903187 RepID=A0AB33BRQ7_MICA7|nr:hypothetical protein BH695_3393 [Microcystis aeruginosa PCC 7806SL]ELS48512.1 hypothetical protein C789_1714 [Microcystis aeruginosa FACHB-905 = DIANCHI905]
MKTKEGIYQEMRELGNERVKFKSRNLTIFEGCQYYKRAGICRV